MGLLIKGVSEIIKDETKEQKSGFLSMVLGLLGYVLTGKGETRRGDGVIRTG